MSENSRAARAWLLARRATIEKDIAILQGRAKEIDALIGELDTVVAPTKSTQEDMSGKYRPSLGIKGPQAQAILAKLRAAGEIGLSSRECYRQLKADEVKCAGPASVGARFTMMKSLGIVRHVGTRYILNGTDVH